MEYFLLKVLLCAQQGVITCISACLYTATFLNESCPDACCASMATALDVTFHGGAVKNT
jgi:hypothetical protein